MSHWVEVVQHGSAEVQKTYGPYHTLREADRMGRVLNRNLDHDRYYTRTVEEPALCQPKP